MQLTDFVTNWSTNTIELPTLNTTSSQQPYRLRPSRLGRPGYVTAVEHLVHLHGLQHEGVVTHEYYGRMQDIFATGHSVEARLVQVMRSAGVQLEYQVPTSFELSGYTIEGTADVIYDDIVIDIKTASASNFKRLSGDYDTLQYRTQLALYAHGLGLKRVALLLYNKDTSELVLKPLQLTSELDRVRSILTELSYIEAMTLDDAYEYVYNTFLIPEPPNQMRQKVPTGLLLTPPELRYEPTVRDVIYTSEVRDGTRYITGHNEDPVGTIRNSYTLRA